ncbi:uncharacterized protein CLUP02_04573 [Colletotrichum lupini]|uniref:Uncharacterized protein n=1 Tax=Colletotrichum lupini TaxID=145971 RepID=A0A9Q8SKM1_9PEZI|nr:uncharacterized protein CLUP02_04573 [Colletotrichum lupini]UQC79094.1 hypothetical protein CLUP02_04573 [Colletotrichum lupini]
MNYIRKNHNEENHLRGRSVVAASRYNPERLLPFKISLVHLNIMAFRKPVIWACLMRAIFDGGLQLRVRATTVQLCHMPPHVAYQVQSMICLSMRRWILLRDILQAREDEDKLVNLQRPDLSQSTFHFMLHHRPFRVSRWSTREAVRRPHLSEKTHTRTALLPTVVANHDVVRPKC